MASLYKLPDLPARIRVNVDVATGRNLVEITIYLPGKQWLELIPWPMRSYVDGDNPVPRGRYFKSRRVANVLIEFAYRWGSWSDL